MWGAKSPAPPTPSADTIYETINQASVVDDIHQTRAGAEAYQAERSRETTREGEVKLDRHLAERLRTVQPLLLCVAGKKEPKARALGSIPRAPFQDCRGG